VPLHNPTVVAPRFARLGRLAALATATFATAGAVVVIADDQPVPSLRTVSEASRPAPTRYFDLEANKAASIPALGRHIAEQQANRTTPYDDLAANKARSQRKL
jgi:hypothetical protein